jgi:hypothetical protein
MPKHCARVRTASLTSPSRRAVTSLVALALGGCAAPSPAVVDAGRADAAAVDVRAHRDVSASVDTSAPPAPDAATPVDDVAPAPDAATPVDDVAPAPDAAPDAGPRCEGDDADALVLALRAAPGPGVSAVAAPGARFEDLRAAFDATPASITLLARVRAYARGNPPTLARGDAGAYQTFSTRALGAALVAWHDRDATAASVALRTLSAMAIEPTWLVTASDVPLRFGAALLAMAAAVDLLSAAAITPAELAAARASLGTAAASIEAWLQAGGLYFTAGHLDNHGMRIGAGLAAAAMVTPAAAVSDDTLRWALAQMHASVQQQTGGAAGWAEGSTYYAYGFEIAAPALTAIDRAWAGDDTRCVRCPGHAVSACGAASVAVVRPSRDPRLRDLVAWSASLETQGAWLAHVDDSRIAGVPSPLLEAMVGARAFARWSIDGPVGSLGASLLVHPFVALALPTPPAASLPRTRVWPAAGTGRVDATAANGAALEAFILGESEAAQAGVGHERPDVATLTLAVGGALMLGASGYGSYTDRLVYARADAASGITVEGDLSRALGAGEAGPAGALTVEGPTVVSRFTASGVAVSRALSFEGATMVVSDTLDVTGAARDVGWHWHLRGALDDARWQWSLGARRCTVTQSGEAPAIARETAPHIDTYGRVEMHPVVRQLARLAVGRHTLVTRIDCE